MELRIQLVNQCYFLKDNWLFSMCICAQTQNVLITGGVNYKKDLVAAVWIIQVSDRNNITISLSLQKCNKYHAKVPNTPLQIQSS